MEAYLTCLDESRFNSSYKPSALGEFILECVLIDAEYVVNTLDNFIKFL